MQHMGHFIDSVTFPTFYEGYHVPMLSTQGSNANAITSSTSRLKSINTNPVQMIEYKVAALQLLHNLGADLGTTGYKGVVRFAVLNTEYHDVGLLEQHYEKWRNEAGRRRRVSRSLSLTVNGVSSSGSLLLPRIDEEWGRV